MKRIVIKYGLIGGAIVSGLMAATVPFQHSIGPWAMVVGYTTMVLAFMMVYFGVRAYRESVGGSVGFWRALSVGLLITLVTCMCYVATWEVIYFNFMPDFLDKYAAQTIEHTRASGASQEKVAEVTRQMEEFKVAYSNPLINAAYTMAEPLPPGILIALFCAGILSRRRRREPGAPATAEVAMG
jgi:hypothetical protein